MLHLQQMRPILRSKTHQFILFGVRNWSVRGLWLGIGFGSRGTFGASVVNFFNEFKLDFSKLKHLCEEILIETIHILNNHI